MTTDTLATIGAHTIISRARALADASTAPELRAYFAAIGDKYSACLSWPALQAAAAGAASVHLRELADLAAAALDGPAPRTAPVEVTDDEDTATRAEVADNPLSPDWAVRMEVGAHTTRSASTWLDADTALTLGLALVGLATEAKRRNLDGHG
jgi:hypothetical protein